MKYYDYDKEQLHMHKCLAVTVKTISMQYHDQLLRITDDNILNIKAHILYSKLICS